MLSAVVRDHENRQAQTKPVLCTITVLTFTLPTSIFNRIVLDLHVKHINGAHLYVFTLGVLAAGLAAHSHI